MSIKRTILENVIFATSVAVFSFIDTLIALPSLINRCANNMSGLLMLAYKTGTIDYVGYGKINKKLPPDEKKFKVCTFYKKGGKF